MKKFDVTLKQNHKYNPQIFTVQVDCESSEGAKRIVHDEYKNLKVGKDMFSGYVTGNKIEIMDCVEVVKAEVANN